MSTFSIPRLLLLAGLWCCLSDAALLLSSPGYALSLNGRSNTEYAYSYPRRLSRQFTLEMWLNGHNYDWTYVVPISISHPGLPDMFFISHYVFVFAFPVTDFFSLPDVGWFHLAVSVDLTAFPAYDVRLYIDGQEYRTGLGQFDNTGGLTPADFEEEVLGLVLGQDQDSMLGDFDTKQMFSGYVDELRIWDTIRTAEEIEAWRNLTLTQPFPAGLVSYYPFDDDEWNATFFQDKVNTSLQHRLYCADYNGSATAPTPPPHYAPPPAPLPRLALSSAPLCSATSNLGWRLQPEGRAAVPVASLYCDAAASSAVTTSVTAVFGGTVEVPNRSNAFGYIFSSEETIWFTTNNSNIEVVEPGTGFNFTVTDGVTTLSGFLPILANHAPVIPSKFGLVIDEDQQMALWVPIADEDRDLVFLEVTEPPDRGLAQVDLKIHRRLNYTPPANANGVDVGVFTVQAHDRWGVYSNSMVVIISIIPVTDPPRILTISNITIYRGQRIAIPFEVVDVDGTNPFVILTDWPPASQGHLEAHDKGWTWTLNEGSVPTKVQWASGFGQFSSQAAPAADDFWGYSIAGIVGMPDCFPEYGDCVNAWNPSLENGCNNLCPAVGPSTTFCSEFFEAKFATPLCLTGFTLWETHGSDRVSRIRVPSDRDPSQWKVVMERDIANSPVSPSATRYSVTSYPVCQIPWLVDTVRVEIDTCHRDSVPGWYGVDAVQMRGSLEAPNNVLNITADLAFQATPGYTGPVEFSLVATSCYGSLDNPWEPVSVKVLVLDTPHVIAVSATEDWFPIDVGQLNLPATRGRVLVLELPSMGLLRYADQVLNASQEDLGSSSTLFYYKPFRCDSTLMDSFIIELGPTAVVQTAIHGCTPTTTQLIPIIVPAVVIPMALAILALVWYWRRHKRDNSKAPKDPTKDICVLFTDIQSSTLLWAEVPHVMAPALDAHHALIRSLIRKYKCYEVKTIGDSFMVASDSPLAAIQLALAIQTGMFHGSEGCELDELYRVATNCSLTPEAYQRCWRGLRVRIGVHYGRAQIIFDDTTKGYDYYGTVVNAAARIEGAAHGGQVLLSRQAFEPVADYCAANDVAVRPLGSVPLRGLPSPLDLVQVLPACFAHRTFPELRTDHSPTPDEQSNGDLEDGPFEDGCSLLYPQALDWDVANHSMVRSGTLSAELAKFHAHDMYYALKYQLNMHDPDERRKRLKELCKQWHVECRVATEKQEDATVGRLALQLMGCVAKANQMQGNSKLQPSHMAPAPSLLGMSEQLPGLSLFLPGTGQATPINAPELAEDTPKGELTSGHTTQTSLFSPTQSGPVNLLSTDDAEALVERSASLEAHRTEVSGSNEVSLGSGQPTPHQIRLAGGSSALDETPRLASERRGWLGNCQVLSSTPSSLPEPALLARSASSARPDAEDGQAAGGFPLSLTAEGQRLPGNCQASTGSGPLTPQRIRSASSLPSATAVPPMPTHLDEPAALAEPATPALVERRGWLASHKAFSSGSSAAPEQTRLSRFMHSGTVHPDAADRQGPAHDGAKVCPSSAPTPNSGIPQHTYLPRRCFLPQVSLNAHLAGDG